jgi:hypothetical protein
MSKQFAAYIVARCFTKMRLRVGHKSSEGFIYCLGQVDEEKLRKAVAEKDGYTYVGRRNLDLMKSVVERPDLLQRYVIDHCPPTYNASEPTRLISAWRRIVDHPQQQAQSRLYDGNTCIDFHQLLVAALLAYGKALDELYESRKNAAMTDLIPLAKQIRYCAGLLWRLAYSGVLRHHLEVLDENDWLHLPQYRPRQVASYQRFTNFLHSEFQKPQDDNDGADDDDDDDDIRHLSKPTANDPVSNVFCRYLRLLGSHWEALSIISHHGELAVSSLTIELVAVKPPNYHPNVCQVGNWKTFIKTLIKEHQPTLPNKSVICPEDVISLLESKIDVGKAKSNSRVYRDFEKARPRWKGTVHCEASLASLILFVILLMGYGDVKALMQVSTVPLF